MVARIVALLAVLAVTACASPAPSAAHRAPAKRIVSLMPSLTEDLCAIGARTQLVGVSQYSSDIACARGLPQVASFASIDAERILTLHPDVVVGIPAQRTQATALTRAGIATVFLPDDSYASLFSDIDALGRIAGRQTQARDLVTKLKTRTHALHASAKFRHPPSVFFVEQAQPIWTVGPQSYISTLIGLAGGRNAVTRLSSAYAQFSPEALLRLQPDAIVATADAGLKPLLRREPWRSLRAVRAGHVYILHDDDLLVRPGPRYNEGIAWLIARLSSQST